RKNDSFEYFRKKFDISIKNRKQVESHFVKNVKRSTLKLAGHVLRSSSTFNVYVLRKYPHLFRFDVSSLFNSPSLYLVGVAVRHTRVNNNTECEPQGGLAVN